MRLFSVLVICVSIGFFSSCSSDEAPISSLCPTIDEADQTALFEFYKDELIIPAYMQAVSDVQVLKSGLDNFLNDPSTDNLLDVQNQLNFHPLRYNKPPVVFYLFDLPGSELHSPEYLRTDQSPLRFRPAQFGNLEF